ncbi:hypothetical protein BAUCODRAFT_168304 [Baudoinia panamericana UAMH 10762]|uniref:Zn(2)-C6 fungal-type domain-containing protein n=1 Tax=Baudoinia panamericana (strain UAMH 10762) TaxID=717646 RepID=M2NLR3_BAUPA|nr:uncharacterized protein BAUCODRAFT_168304 [Baudoinia panamericana UAMH 10762]EMD00435.1 hypothetical protein BAUCODRAFT_168304 [Baudoinia panamericana UAMH 10762]
MDPFPPLRSTAKVNKRKLRESCTECSSSKVKCGKQKPDCSRCEQRSLQCVYEFSHRAGRRQVRPTTADRTSNTSNSADASLQVSRESTPRQTARSSMAGFENHMLGSPDLTAATQPDDFLNSLNSNVLQLFDDFTTWPSTPMLSESSAAMSMDPFSETMNAPSNDFDVLDSFSFAPTSSALMSPPLVIAQIPSSHHVSDVSRGKIRSMSDISMPDSDIVSADVASDTIKHGLCREAAQGRGSCRNQLFNIMFFSKLPSVPDINGFGVLPQYRDDLNSTRTTLEITSAVLECTCVLESDELVQQLACVALDVMSSYSAIASATDVQPVPQTPVHVGDGMVLGGDRDVALATQATRVFGELHRVLHLIEGLASLLRFRERSQAMSSTDSQSSASPSRVGSVSGEGAALGQTVTAPEIVPRHKLCEDAVSLDAVEAGLRERFSRLAKEVRLMLAR